MTGQVSEMNGTRERTETIIIGGGQSGLAVGYHLTRQGRPFVILDANEQIGDSWRKRWDSLRVFTPARLSGLPGMPFPAPASSFPSKDDVADYLVAYAARFDLPVRTGVRVDELSRLGDRFVVTSGDRRFEADNVVVGTGAYHNPRLPVFASELDPAIVQMHSSEYRSPSQLPEGGALVVGAGNSGAEIALEASRGHRTWLSGRDPGHEPVRPGSGPDRLVIPLMWFAATHVLTVRTPVGRKVQRKFRYEGRTSPPLGSSSCRERRASTTACRCWRTDGSSTCRT
jgi:putative flavoprotein involved in K+ transport